MPLPCIVIPSVPPEFTIVARPALPPVTASENCWLLELHEGKRRQGLSVES